MRAWESFRREQAVLSKGVHHPACLRTKEVLYVDDRGWNHYKYLSPACVKYSGNLSPKTTGESNYRTVP